ncbi:MAG: dihydrolipoyllysine-residue acetyltransferase [Pseudohongiellaceae bacterium]
MATENIKVPDLGDASDVEVIELLVSVGDKVSENDSLLVLESDKAAMEIPAPMSGVVKSIAVNLGDQVSTGNDILTLEVDGEGSDSSAAGEDKDADADQDESAKDSEKQAGEGKVEKSQQSKDDKSADKDKSKAGQGSGGGQSRITDVEVPDLGTEDEVEVIELHIAAGDSVSADDSLITLESDKAAMEVPSPQDGTVEELLVKVGDKIKTGSKIVKLKVTDSGDAGDSDDRSEAKQDTKTEKDDKPSSDSGSGKSADKAAPAQPQAPATSSDKSDSAKVYAGPAVRKLARELGVDLTQVQGSGAKSRIVKEDIHEFVKARINQAPAGGGGGFEMPAIEDIDFSQFGDVEKVERSKLDKLTARNMHRNWTLVPQVAQFNEADVTDLEDFRAELKPEAEKRDTRLTFLPFLLKACAKALAEYPQFNVSLHSSGEYLIQKKYCHIGVAVATPAGLVVPVIRDVDKKSLWELADEVLEMTDKAKKRKLGREDMQGACFTISSLGAIGGTGFIPIVNAPEVAILGVSKTTIKPVYIDGEFKPRKMLPLTLTYDHKAVNGVDGGMFADYLVTVLGDIRRLIL